MLSLNFNLFRFSAREKHLDNLGGGFWVDNSSVCFLARDRLVDNKPEIIFRKRKKKNHANRFCPSTHPPKTICPIPMNKPWGEIVEMEIACVHKWWKTFLFSSIFRAPLKWKNFFSRVSSSRPSLVKIPQFNFDELWNDVYGRAAEVVMAKMAFGCHHLSRRLRTPHSTEQSNFWGSFQSRKMITGLCVCGGWRDSENNSSVEMYISRIHYDVAESFAHLFPGIFLRPSRFQGLSS